ncbi:hypothetical protein HanPSC8_Chr04g0172521 [Helianthus annuus]|nr:hypothetical protein HanPSC8_Chr04g0172521 [Helianthus annuus]
MQKNLLTKHTPTIQTTNTLISYLSNFYYVRTNALQCKLFRHISQTIKLLVEC